MKYILNIIKKYYITFISFALLFIVYNYISINGLFNKLMFPAFNKVIDVYLSDYQTIFNNLISSIELLIPAIIIMLLISLSLGCFLGRNEFFRDVLNPVIYAFSCVPSILMTPFLIVLLPSFWWASIVMIVYATVWATLFATITGVQTIDKRYLDIAKTLKISGIKKLFKIILPAASPTILGGLVNSIRSSFVMLVFAEMYGAGSGMGYYVRNNTRLGLYNRMWAGLIFMVIVLIVVMSLIEKLKNSLLKWTTNQ